MRKKLTLGLPRTKEFRLGLFVSILQGVFAVSLLATSAWLISRAAEQPPVMYLMVAVVGVRGFALGRAAARYAERMLLHNSAFKLLSQQRPRILQKLIPFAPAGLPDRGQMISRMVNDVDSLQDLPVRVLAPIAQSSIVSLLAILGMAWLLPAAGLALGVLIAGAFFLALPISARVSKVADQKTAAAKAKLAENNLELLENLDVLSAFGWLSASLDSVNATSKSLAKMSDQTAYSAGVGQGLVSAFTALATVVLAWLGAVSVSEGQNAGVLLAVFALLPMAVFELIQAAQPAISAWQRYANSAARISDFLDADTPPEVVPSGGQLQVPPTTAQVPLIEFQSVSARYPGGALVIRDLDFTLMAGQKLVLHGPSGSGKSTVANLALGFLNASSGRVLINGLDLGEISTESLHKSVGLVEQQPTIFLGSVRDNLAFAGQKLTDNQMIEALKSVKLWRMFESRQGLDTQLGERGVLISGGEAQRLAVARAILADFEVLILDEPTANVDRDTAIPLVSEILNAIEGRSVILITHDSELSALGGSALYLPN